MRGSGRFFRFGTRLARALGVSIPFIAGQWSLRAAVAAVAAWRRVSIPFIAGQWSLLAPRPAPKRIGTCFNPLHCGAVVASLRQEEGAEGSRTFQSPSLRGSGRFENQLESLARLRERFQSPSLRGSGRFTPPGTLTSERSLVSIPFIAGQWSLRDGAPPSPEGGRAFQSPSLRGSGRFALRVRDGAPSNPGFNPLHCGAVVASRRPRRRPRRVGDTGFNPLHCGAVVASSHPLGAGARHGGGFQSPSLRGSGRFRADLDAAAGVWLCFNPLHCGAVVASRGLAAPRPRRLNVSIPFIAGQWSLQSASSTRRRSLSAFNPLHCGAVVASDPRGPFRRQRDLLSIPFIAGQWSLLQSGSGGVDPAPPFQSPSLRGSGRFPPPPCHTAGEAPTFNPLHCGAVVASCGGRRRGSAPPTSFNPLHCGAVVASTPRRRGSPASPSLSIPFIAGQWSLRGFVTHVRLSHAAFQSPSLRGSGRFRPTRRGAQKRRRLSIPFIAGQWSLRTERTEDRRRKEKNFQSPSLRGSGRFNTWNSPLSARRRCFQSPSLRGSGRFAVAALLAAASAASFNPLHCGAVVASSRGARRRRNRRRLSIPFIAGQWSLP